MKTANNKLLRLATFGFAALMWMLGIGTNALAQPSQGDASLRGLLEEVVVTARRREEASQSVPIPISALSSEQLEARGLRDVREVEKLTPNMRFVESVTSGGTSSVSLRGIGQVNWSAPQDPKVGIYVDGVYLGRPQGGIFDLMDVERIEVLRGPQGTLFGRNTTAGLIHVITKKPHDQFEAKVLGRAGNDGQYTIAGMVNFPISEKVSGRVALQQREADGWMTDNQGREWNSIDRLSGRGALYWTPRDTFDLQVNFDAYRARDTNSLANCEYHGPENDAMAVGLAAISNVLGRLDDLKRACSDPDSNVYTSNDNDPNDADTDVLAGSVTWNLEMKRATLSSISAVRRTEAVNSSWGWGTDFAGDVSNLLEVIKLNDAVFNQRFADEFEKNGTWNRQISQEFRFSGSALDGGLDWTAGAYWFTEDTEQIGDVPLYRNVPNPTVQESPLYHASPMLAATARGTRDFGSRTEGYLVTNSSWALFAEGTYRLTDSLDITAGIRYTEDDREYTRVQTLSSGAFDGGNLCPGNPTIPFPLPGAPDNVAATRDRCYQEASYDEVTPRVILSYNLNSDMMLYGSYSKGYSSGGFNSDIQMQRFRPEVSDNYESGFKFLLLDQRLKLNATVFRNDYKNQQITVARNFNNQPTAAVINAQDATLEGVELEMVALLGDNLALNSTIGFLSGDYDEFIVQDQDTDAITGITTYTDRDLTETELVTGSPETVSVGITWTLQLNGGNSLVTNVGAAYAGRQYNTLESADTSRQPGRTLIDARITWSLGNNRTALSFWGQNLTDKQHFVGAVDLSVGGLPNGTVSKYYAHPRYFGLEVSHLFGN